MVLRRRTIEMGAEKAAVQRDAALRRKAASRAGAKRGNQD